MTDLIIAALAAHRLVVAWFDEKIGEPARLWAWKAVEIRMDIPAVNTAVDVAAVDSDSQVVVAGEDADGWEAVDVIVLDSDRVAAAKAWGEELISCRHCIGFWFSAACAIGVRFRATRPLVVALAASTIVSTIVRHTSTDD